MSARRPRVLREERIPLLDEPSIAVRRLRLAMPVGDGTGSGVPPESDAAGEATWEQVVIDESGGRRGVVLLAFAGLRLALVRQWREAVGAELWELPRGFAQDDDVLVSAQGEAGEELGVRLESTQVLGELSSNSGLLSSRIAVVAGSAVPEPEAARDEVEVGEVAWLPVEEAHRLLLSQQPVDAISLAALGMWSASLD